MRVRALDSFCIGGGVDVKVGETFDCDPMRAVEWLALGHVEAVVEEDKSAPRDDDRHPEAGPGVVAGADMRPRNREPRGARGR